MPSLIEILKEKRVIVCCGSGGVGKTTMSAALAIRAAQEGKKAVVVTIDPAKRLATSLGLKSLDSTPTDLTPIIGPVKGSLHAVMPDTTRTFEAFVRKMAGKNERLGMRILRTSIYKIFAKEFSGTNEYMAMEKLYDLYNEGGYDLIVLDTPPSANTKLFLEAPSLLEQFFDESIIHWIIAPGSRLIAASMKVVMEVLERLTGRGFVSELIEFTTALFELRAQFMENLVNVGTLLRDHRVSFLMVTSPERLSKKDTKEFLSLLKERSYPFWGFIVNRVLTLRLGLDPNSKIDLKKLVSELNEAGTDSGEAEILSRNFEKLVPVIEHEREIEGFLATVESRESGIALIAEQSSDVHSVDCLLLISKAFT